jgi:hypothetical protein
MRAAVRSCSHPFPQRRYLQRLRSKRANASEPERTPNLAILATEPGARNHRSRRTSAARLGGILRDSVNVVERRPGHARGRGFESRRSRLEKRLQIGTLCCLLGPWPIRDRAPAGQMPDRRSSPIRRRPDPRAPSTPPPPTVSGWTLRASRPVQRPDSARVEHGGERTGELRRVAKFHLDR